MLQLLSGMIASALHVITGPDHLAAVTPLAIESKRKAWAIGVMWGLGHLLGMMLIGGLFLLFKDLIPVELISGRSEILVGIVLIVLGTWSIVKAYVTFHKPHKHPHFHSEPEPYVHIHSHVHDDEFEHDHKHEKVHKQGKLTALSIGTLHGFAGISHFLLVLPTLALPTFSDSLLYLSGFAIGTVGSMASYAIILGIISTRSVMNRSHKIFNGLRLTGGIIALIVGIIWVFHSV
jgi:ABC-type nickel/cobalt efflux system permease component RcnA